MQALDWRTRRPRLLPAYAILPWKAWREKQRELAVSGRQVGRTAIRDADVEAHSYHDGRARDQTKDRIAE